MGLGDVVDKLYLLFHSRFSIFAMADVDTPSWRAVSASDKPYSPERRNRGHPLIKIEKVVMELAADPSLI